jgi:hypothetical protein
MKPGITFLCCLFLSSLAWSYPVAPALPLDGLVKEADIIVKATVVSSDKIADESFKSYPHWAVFSTRLAIVSVLKGNLAEKEFDFHHYDEDTASNQGYMFSPQHYHFERGATYIIFAKSTTTPGLLRPVWDYHRGREDQGQVLAADAKPVPPGTSVKRAVWQELSRLAESDEPAKIQYAIRQLHAMSGSDDRFDQTSDFPRDQVLAILAPLIGYQDQQVASAAIEAVGSRSPYRGEDYAIGWLATVGKGSLLARGQGKYPDNWDNPEARQFQARLVEVADKASAPALRARAIRALGLSKGSTLLEPLQRWSADPAPEVRAAAAVLWSEFPGDQAAAQLTRFSADRAPAVRRAVAAAVGFGQSPNLLPLLATLLKDKDENVRAMAAMSTVSFDPKESGALLKTFRNDPDFHASFIDALALADPKPWLDDLAQVVRDNAEPKLHFVAQMPVYTSWQILKSEIEARPVGELVSGKLDIYLDALDQPPNIGSGPYQEMYQFYRDKGLKDRAARFRALAKKRVKGYDIDYYFNRIDGVAQP